MYPSRLRSPRAYSISEVLVSMTLFAFMALSLLSATMYIRRSSEEAVYQNTALILGQAYLEQIRSTDYATLAAAAVNSNTPLILTNSAGATLTDANGGTMNNRDYAQETIMLDETATGQPKQPMTFRFRPILTDLTTTTGGVAQGVEIILYYETTYNFGTPRTHYGSLRTVRSNVPTF